MDQQRETTADPGAPSTAWRSPVALARGLAARPKLYLSIAAALPTILVAPDWMALSARAVLAWDVGALVYVTLAFWLFSACGADHIRQAAAAEDETRFVFFGLILLSVLSSFAAIVGLISEARSAKGWLVAAYLTLAGGAIVASWMIVQIVFTLHYAHDYYRAKSAAEDLDAGLRFPEQEQPDYWDFLYFTTSIGATSQTSDVAVTSRPMRRLVTLQAILAFIFNTTVVALAINLAASLL